MIRLGQKNVLAIAITACSITAFAGAATELSNEAIEVHTIVVTGTATSGLDNLITHDDLDESQASSLNEIFRNQPDVSAGGAVSLGQKLYVRDIGEDIVNISVDGAEQASGVFHHTGRISVEPELLKQVEVEAGAGSATAGPGALGGSVRFTTKDAADLLDNDRNFGALLKSSYSSNGDGFKNSATLYGRSENDFISGIVSLVNSDWDTVVDGDGNDIQGTATEKVLGYGKLVLQPTDEHRLSLSYENLNEETETARRPEWTVSSWNPLQEFEGERETLIFNHRYTSQTNELIDTYLNVYQTTHDLHQKTYDYTGSVESIGATVQNTSIAGNHELTYGFNVREDESISEDTSFASYPKEKGLVWGLYVQDVFDLSSALTVTAGLRYDHYELEDWENQEFENSGFSPNISANYAFNSHYSVSAGYAKAIRGAEIFDAYKLGSNYNDEDLTAEIAHNAEIGFNYSDNRFTFGSGVYYTVIEDPIGYDYDDGLTKNLNDDIETYGIYANTEFSAGKLTIGANAKIASTKADGEEVTRYVYGSNAVSTGHSLGINLDYEFHSQFTAGWDAQFVAGIYDIEVEAWGETMSIDKPGYMVHDLHANWKVLKNHDLNLSLRINNLFDEQYLSHTSTEDFEDTWEGVIGSYEPGRDIRVTASYKY